MAPSDQEQFAELTERARREDAYPPIPPHVDPRVFSLGVALNTLYSHGILPQRLIANPRLLLRAQIDRAALEAEGIIVEGDINLPECLVLIRMREDERCLKSKGRPG